MASIINDSGGRKRIQFVAPDGKRKAIRLGKVSTRQAQSFCLKVENLVAKLYTGSLDPETTKWQQDLDDANHEKLARVGLVDSRSRNARALGGFLDQYIDSRVDAKPTTITVFRRVRKHLVTHFGEIRTLQSITDGDVDQWRLYLIGAGLADNTVRRHCGVAKQFFRSAVRLKLIDRNPFDEQVCTVRGNKARDYFVTRAEAQAVLDVCPGTEWALMFALARFGGLRCPSEILSLKWGHIDWEQNRMIVPSPKTEHHEGHESRVIPIFPEVLPYLLKAETEAPEGSEYVITRYRSSAVNLRSRLLDIIAKAKLKPWPKLWQNLRSTRETELAETFPIQVVVAWIGNSEVVAREHYLQVLPEHFERAINAQIPPVGSLGSAAHNAAQLGNVSARHTMKSPAPEHTEVDESKGFTKPDEMLPEGGLGVGGLE